MFASRRRRIEWLVRGVIPRAEIGVIYGASTAGKSFFAIDLFAAVARGVEWHGHWVESAARVVYVVAEGAFGFGQRLRAYAAGKGLELDQVPLEVVDAAPNFMAEGEPLELAAQIGRADVVVIDTLSRAIPGGDENSSRDMGGVLERLKRLHAATGALVVLILHPGKDLDRGAGGWSGLRAAADFEVEVSRTVDTDGTSSLAIRQARVTKMKDGPDGEVVGFVLDPIDLGEDQDGQSASSARVRFVDPPRTRGTARTRRLGDVEQVLVQVHRELAGGGAAGVTESDLVATAAAKLPRGQGRRDSRSARSRRAMDTLLGRGFSYPSKATFFSNRADAEMPRTCDFRQVGCNDCNDCNVCVVLQALQAVDSCNVCNTTL